MLEATMMTTMPTPRNTNRCRHRRITTSAARLTSHSTCRATGVASTPTTSATRVSAGVRVASNACRTRVSARSNTETLPVTQTAIQASTTAPEATSHHFPDLARCRGRGGGSPEGRRRRRTRRRSGGGGRATVPVTVTAGGSVAMPRNGPPEWVPATALSVLLWPPAAPRGGAVHARRASCAVLAVVLGLLTACSGGARPPAAQLPAGTVRFAAYDFSENQILVAVY